MNDVHTCESRVGRLYNLYTTNANDIWIRSFISSIRHQCTKSSERRLVRLIGCFESKGKFKQSFSLHPNKCLIWCRYSSISIIMAATPAFAGSKPFTGMNVIHSFIHSCIVTFTSYYSRSEVTTIKSPCVQLSAFNRPRSIVLVETSAVN